MIQICTKDKNRTIIHNIHYNMLIKLTYVSFRAHVKIAYLVVSYCLSSSAANPTHVIFMNSGIGIMLRSITYVVP